MYLLEYDGNYKIETLSFEEMIVQKISFIYIIKRVFFITYLSEFLD